MFFKKHYYKIIYELFGHKKYGIYLARNAEGAIKQLKKDYCFATPLSIKIIYDMDT